MLRNSLVAWHFSTGSKGKKRTRKHTRKYIQSTGTRRNTYSPVTHTFPRKTSARVRLAQTYLIQEDQGVKYDSSRLGVSRSERLAPLVEVPRHLQRGRVAFVRLVAGGKVHLPQSRKQVAVVTISATQVRAPDRLRNRTRNEYSTPFSFIQNNHVRPDSMKKNICKK